MEYSPWSRTYLCKIVLIYWYIILWSNLWCLRLLKRYILMIRGIWMKKDSPFTTIAKIMALFHSYVNFQKSGIGIQVIRSITYISSFTHTFVIHYELSLIESFIRHYGTAIPSNSCKTLSFFLIAICVAEAILKVAIFFISLVWEQSLTFVNNRDHSWILALWLVVL